MVLQIKTMKILSFVSFFAKNRIKLLDIKFLWKNVNRCWCASVYKLLLIPKQLRHNMSEHVLLRVMHFLLKRPLYLLSRENEEKLEME